MSDKAHKKVDEMIEQVEKELLHNYSVLLKDISKELKEVYTKLDIVGIEDLEERVRLLNKSKRLEKLINTLATEIQNVNKTSVNIVNDNLYNVYALNNEFGAYLVEKASGYDTNYVLFNREAIKQIVKKELTPFTKMAYDGIKDKDTIIRDLTREIFQSIVSGESIKDLAKRVQKITEKNMNDSIRIAQTEMTRCQNAGRMDSFKRGEEMGLKLRKVWISTLDSRTRHSHAMMMLQERKLDEEFSNGLQHPGGIGPAKEVVRCRCTMVTEFVGIEKGAKELELDEKLKSMSYERWKDYRGGE